MRADLKDKQVCEFCNGTGSRVYKSGGYSYSVKCEHVPQPELPLDALAGEAKNLVQEEVTV